MNFLILFALVVLVGIISINEAYALGPEDCTTNQVWQNNQCVDVVPFPKNELMITTSSKSVNQGDVLILSGKVHLQDAPSLMPPLNIANPRLVDAYGNKILDPINVNQPVQITADVKNNQEKSQNFVYLVQIKNHNGVVMSLEWISGLLNSGQTFSPALSWNPKISDAYTVEIFVWDVSGESNKSWQRLNSLATPITLSITDNGHVSLPLMPSSNLADDVEIIIRAPNYNIATVFQVHPDIDGSFETSIKTDGPQFKLPGKYTIFANFYELKSEVTFEFTGGTGDISGLLSKLDVSTGLIIDDFAHVEKPTKNRIPNTETQIIGLIDSPDPESYAKQNNLIYEEGWLKVLVTLANNEYLNSINHLGIVDHVDGNFVQMNVPIERLEQLLAMPEVSFVQSPPKAIPQTTSEGLGIINVNAVRSSLTGKNVKVGIFDLAFDVSNKEIKNNVSPDSQSFRNNTTGELIPISGEKNDENIHGTAVAEIINDVAPNAQLHLYAFETSEDFKNAINYSSGKVDVMVMSMAFQYFPTDGSSNVTKNIERIIHNGTPFVVSAGNYAQSHWKGLAVDSDNDGWIEFQNGGLHTQNLDEGITITIDKNKIPPYAHIRIDSFWQQRNDFDLVLIHPNNKTTPSTNFNEDGKIFEYIDILPEQAGDYTLGVLYRGTLTNTNLELFGSSSYPFEHNIPESSAPVPTDADGVISVGAMSLEKEYVKTSSYGPTANNKTVPILMGPTNVTTISKPNFTGTSAAAPHVGGVVALMLEKNKDLTPAEIKEGLIRFSQNHNNYKQKTGYGMVDASFLNDDKKDVLPPPDNENGGGCLIATATFGTELAPQIQQLRELRDNKLLQTESGTSFMKGFNQFYYSFSPTIADWERENPTFKEFVKITITPMISSLSIMTLAEDGFEVEVLGLGLFVIALNLGMYFVAPGIVIHTVRKKF